MSAMQVMSSTSTINTIKEDATKFIEKQGIVTILESNFQQNNNIPPSLRRTISVDMSSKNWLSQSGISTMKRASSFQELVASTNNVDNQEAIQRISPTHDDVWRSIQSQKEKGGSIWSSILCEKQDNDIGTNKKILPPYVHPLLRKSTSNLSLKSLEICTESLGSETGSEGFSSHNNTQKIDEKTHEKEEKIEPKMLLSEDFEVVKYNYNPSHKKVAQKKSFPPPLPSLSSRNDGCNSLHMQPHRENGRLVLEAVSVPQQNYLQIDRQEGRLVLTLVNNDPQEPTSSPGKLEEQVTDFQEVFDNFEEFDANEDGLEDVQEEEDEDQMTILVEQKSSSLPTSGRINIPMMKSFLGMEKKDTLWSNKMNKVVELMEAEQLQPPAVAVARLIPKPPTTSVARLIQKPPPQPPTSIASALNAYEYFWRMNNKSFEINSSILTQKCNWDKLEYYNNNDKVDEEVVIMRGNKGDYYVPLVCKEKRRSLLVWQQPHCIATT